MSQLISVDRLKEIAETAFDDVEDQSRAVNDLAVAVLQVMQMASQPAAAPQQPAAGGRKPGRPIPPECRTTTCKRCGDDVVVFMSKNTGNPYLCDMVMGEYGKKRQFLTASNWLHKCGGNR